MKLALASTAASVTSASLFGKNWNKWYYGLDYRIREGASDADSTKVIFSNALNTDSGLDTNTVSWSIELKSIVNEDTGESILIMTHIYTGRVLYADVLEFDVRFTNSGTTNTSIAQDNVRCTMNNDVRNTAYWEVDALDGYYSNGADDNNLANL